MSGTSGVFTLGFGHTSFLRFGRPFQAFGLHAQRCLSESYLYGLWPQRLVILGNLFGTVHEAFVSDICSFRVVISGSTHCLPPPAPCITL